MTVEMTLLIQLALSIVGATATIAVLIVQKKVKKEILLIFSWMLYTFYIFWGMNVVRFVLLYNKVTAYENHGHLLLLDTVFAAGSTVFLIITGTQDSKRDIKLKMAACAALAVVSLVCFVLLIREYSNINAAIYCFLQPDSIVLLGFIILFCYLLRNRFLKSEQCKKISVVNVAVAMLFVITLLLYPTYETMITNADEFLFEISDVWYLFAIFGVLVFAVTMTLLGLVSERRCTILCVCLWAFSVSAYLQGMFLNGSLFLMDGNKLEWSDSFKTVNFVIWCVFLAGLTALYFWAKRFAQKIVIYSSFLLCAMQAVGVVSLIPTYRESTAKGDALYENYLSMKGMDEVASGENVIVFVLDTYDVDFLEQILDKQPDFLEPLRGFIYYPDNVSQFSRTFPSIPYMLTEETYFYEEPLTEYVNRAFSECSFWEDLRRSGYKYYLFEEDENIIGDSVLKYAENFTRKGNVSEEEISFWGCAETAVRIGNYRLMPYLLKECFTYTSEEINDRVVSNRILDSPMYDEEDAFLWKQLKDSGLTIGNDSDAFRFIHTKGAHAPYTMNAYGEKVSEDKCTPEQVYEGCMRFVYDYLSQMQCLGVYDQATIIITADHGENFVLRELSQETNPILFIKPSGVSADEPMQISDIMASQNDLLPTLAAAIGIAYDEQWGLNLLDSEGKDRSRIRYHYYSVVENGIQTKTKKYNIDGNSRNFDNWTATDEYHEFGEFY